ncbi:MAG TPA: sigma-70 family RNA polymerase sigma factor [Vicinamibacterales bacterium]|nr:sigma-70 family RNA polymerase sigma factor [Vicinamibacterales bacterium]
MRAQREAELLVVRCQLGERDAFEELIATWNGPLFQYARRMCADEEAARDAVQDVWLRVLRGIQRLRDGSRLRPWLFGIARRVLMDRFRALYAAPPASDMDASDVAASVVDEDLETDLNTMHAGLARLPVVEREVLTLFYLQEQSLAETADVLGIPVGTVKSRLFRARVLLRRELDKEGWRS